jgi:hypothetical protein
MGWSYSQLQYLCEQLVNERIKQDIKKMILAKAKEHSEKYHGQMKEVAYQSYLAGMEAMSEIMER